MRYFGSAGDGMRFWCLGLAACTPEVTVGTNGDDPEETDTVDVDTAETDAPVETDSEVETDVPEDTDLPETPVLDVRVFVLGSSYGPSDPELEAWESYWEQMLPSDALLGFDLVVTYAMERDTHMAPPEESAFEGADVIVWKQIGSFAHPTGMSGWGNRLAAARDDGALLILLPETGTALPTGTLGAGPELDLVTDDPTYSYDAGEVEVGEDALYEDVGALTSNWHAKLVAGDETVVRGEWSDGSPFAVQGDQMWVLTGGYSPLIAGTSGYFDNLLWAVLAESLESQ